MELLKILGTIEHFLRGDREMVVTDVKGVRDDIKMAMDVYCIELGYRQFGLNLHTIRRYQGDSPPDVGTRYRRKR